MLVPCVQGKVVPQTRAASDMSLVGMACAVSGSWRNMDDAGLFDFHGFLRPGVGDPRQLQPAVKAMFRAPTVATLAALDRLDDFSETIERRQLEGSMLNARRQVGVLMRPGERGRHVNRPTAWPRPPG